MKYLLFRTLLFLLPFYTYANQTLFSSDQAAVQHYQVVGNKEIKDNGYQLVNANSAPYATVKKVTNKPINASTASAKSMQLSTQDKSQVALAPHANQNNDVYLGQHVTNNIKMENKITQLTQIQLLFQENVRQEIERLSEQNMALNAKVQSLYQQVGALNHQLSQAQTSINNTSQLTNNLSGKLSSKLIVLSHAPVRLIALIILLTLAIYAFYRLLSNHPQSKIHSKEPVPAQSQVQKTEASGGIDDDEGEYDFMQSKEGMTAQLDLARAYCAMGDHESARQVLKTVSEKGNAQQKEEALALVKQLDNDGSASS